MNKIVLTGKGTDLAVLENLTPADLFAPGGTEPVFEAISKEVAAFVGDVSTEAGRKEFASMAYKIAQSKNFLDKVGKIFNSDLKEKTKAVDKERAAIWDKLEALQAKVSAPLDAYKAAEDARVQTHKDAMATIGLAACASDRINLIEEAIGTVTEHKARQWDEFADMANQAITEALTTLNARLVAAQKAAADQAELEALRAAKAAQDAKDAEASRQKAADEQRAQIERDAAAKAQRDAEAAIQAEKDKAAKAAADAAAALKAAEDKAAKDKADADARAKAADEARIAAEAKAKLEADAAVQREKDRAAAEAKRLADEATASRKVRDEIYAGIKGCIEYSSGEIVDDWESVVDSIVAAILTGKVKHVKVTY